MARIPAAIHHRSNRAYTIIEMLTTLAAMMILLGIMVSLARHVRATSASDLTKDLLRRLDEAMARYINDKNNGRPPNIPLFIPEPAQAGPQDMPLEEPPRTAETATAAAEANNRAVVGLLKAYHVFPDERFADLSISYYNGFTVRDAWGTPIVLMPRMHPAIGMAAKGWFFFSAGPDRNFLTKSDNLYSYELPGLDR